MRESDRQQHREHREKVDRAVRASETIVLQAHKAGGSASLAVHENTVEADGSILMSGEIDVPDSETFNKAGPVRVFQAPIGPVFHLPHPWKEGS